jgi:pimeloyl-ACP methyl ester carboxylesterase
MHHFTSDGVDIAYLDEGEGDPILLIHGFASTATVNWVSTNWVATLRHAHRRVVAFDNRGHGASTKFYAAAQYTLPRMADDARRLLDHLRIERADILGYSMGARIGTFLALDHPERVRSLVLGGIAMGLVNGMRLAEEIVSALDAPNHETIPPGIPRNFRGFADQTRSDRRALAACMLGTRETVTRERLAMLKPPVLVAVGENDTIAGPGEPLARLIPDAEFVLIPRRDHMRATGDPVFKAAVLAFLAKRP